MDELKKQVEKLTAVREMWQHSVDDAKTQGDEIEKVVENWLTKVDEFTEGVVKPIIDDQDKVGKLCSIGFCPNLMARYSLSKKAAKTAKDGLDLLGEGKFDKVSYRPLLRKTISTYMTDDYEDFESRKLIFQEIMQALKDDNSKMIGVYGMGGVGKTTLVKRVVAQAIEDKLFDFETTVDITDTPDIKKIQQQIAEELGLNFHEESLSTRAVRLRDRLKKEKKVLVVLDNIWAKLDLEAVGIPFGHEEEKGSSILQEEDQKVGIPFGHKEEKGSSSLQEEDAKGRNDDQRRCKILLTSRSEDVLSNDMNAEKNFLVEILSKEEAGNLFWKIVGDATKTCDFEAIGVEIIQYCAGLPVAIATIASALTKRSLFHWKDALDQLRRSNPRHIKGMEAKVYSALKLSYDFLESEEAKALFLLCSLENASSNISFDYLLRYCMGLGLFQNVSTLEQGRNRLHTLINHLKASCLLLDGNTEGGVKMHDIIHAVAVSIASTDKLMFNIQDVTDLKEMLEEKLPKDSTAISLCRKDVSMLPERLEYPKLKLFFLVMEEFSLQIPDTFFEGMKKLEVLEMMKIHMLSLPSSLSKLTNLQTLCLNECQLRNVAIIGELKRLEILCFLGSDVEQLPTQIGQLIQLRLLELRNCTKLKVISPNVISSMTRLEELYMGNSFIQWEVDGQSNASLSELTQLSCLTTLEIHVLDAQIMPQDMVIFEKLERYRIIIGDVWEWSHDFVALRMLKLKLNNSIYLRNGVKSLLHRTEHLYLDKLNGVKNVIYQLNGEGFPQLKHLHVQNDQYIQYIVNSIGWGPCNVFPKLESMFLHNLINLEKICHGQLATESFNKLKIMKIGRCDGLKHLFSFSIAKNLLQLQEIEVTNCKKLEEIVYEESHEQFQQNDSVSKIEFTHLRTMSLRCLPQLTSFGFKESTPYAGSEEIFAEDKLGGFVPSFSQNVLLPSLENLKLSSINIECMWLDQLPAISSSCQTLTSLTVEECSRNLKFLFSYSMVKSLVQLEILEIRNCKSIEEIINTDELREEGKMIKMVFAKLIKLQLKGLPNLTQFGSGNSVEFPFLTQLSIEDCPKLKTFSHALASADIKQSNEIEQMNCQYDIHPLFGETVVLPTLASMNLSSICIQTVWLKHLQSMSSSFQNLTEIVMDGCDTLKYVYSSSMVESLIQLKNLKISNCKFMEAVIITQGERTSNILFPKLILLHLKHLPKFTSFCNFEGKSIELPSLTELCLENCPKMQAFVSNTPDADIPTNKEEQVNSEQSLHANIQPLFDEKIQLPNLKVLFLDKMDRLRKIWHHQLTSDSFCNFESLEVNNCHNLLIVFPSNMLGRLQKLDQLCLRNCSSLDEIFELQASICGRTQAITATQLRKLELNDLPKLKHVWNMDSQGLLSFPNLLSIKVTGCDTLKSIFPASVGRNLLRLEELWIENCCMVEEIFAKEEEVNEVVPRFPRLTLLILSDLSRLQSFYPMVHISEWPMLKRFYILGCDKIEISASKNLRFQVSDGESQHEMLLLDKVPLTNLERLGLDWKWIEKEALHEKLPQYLCKLKFLTFNAFLKGADNCVFCFLNKLPNLEKLQVTRGFFKEVFLSEGLGCEEEHVETPSKLSNLRLVFMYDSLHLWEEKSLCSKVFQNLAILEVASCDNLKSLVPSHVSFQNLTTLEVVYCNELLNLVAVSTAKSLVQLTKLSISECKMIQEIIIHEGDEVEDCIIFKKLRYVKLECLPSLTSFYSGNYTIEFPSLQQVVVIECPKMQIFSRGILNAPRLHTLQTTEAEGYGFWEDDLNTTIEHLFIENGQSSKEN